MQRWVRLRVICMNCEQFMMANVPMTGQWGLICPFCRGVRIWPVWMDGGPAPRPR